MFLLISMTGSAGKEAGYNGALSAVRRDKKACKGGGAVQCLAGYYHMICGHILDENYKWGVLVNTCKEFGLYHPQKGDHLSRASLPPSVGINPYSGW